MQFLINPLYWIYCEAEAITITFREAVSFQADNCSKRAGP